MTTPASPYDTYATDPPALYAALARCARALWHMADLRLLYARVFRWEGASESERWQVDDASIIAAVETLVVAGLLDCWHHPDGPAYILSAWAAENLGLELDGTGRRWRSGRGKSPRARNKRRKDVKSATDAGVDLEAVIDEWQPEIDFEPSRPNVLLGERLQWNGPASLRRKYDPVAGRWTRCAGCRDEPPTRSRTCLLCDDKPPKT